MNGSYIAYTLFFVCGILAIQLITNVLGEIFALFAVNYLILGTVWNDLGKDPNERNQKQID
jgi:hypothetical protein